MKTENIIFIITTGLLYFGAKNVIASPSICAEADPTVVTYYPYPGDCSKFVQCYDQVGTVFNCSEGLWWHPEVGNCDYPGDYCSQTTGPPITTTSSTTTVTTTTTITTTTEPTTTTTNPSTPDGSDPRCDGNSTSYWPHPAFCGRYIECYRGDSYEMACPPGLFFSDERKVCVNADESECCTGKPQCTLYH